MSSSGRLARGHPEHERLEAEKAVKDASEPWTATTGTTTGCSRVTGNGAIDTMAMAEHRNGLNDGEVTQKWTTNISPVSCGRIASRVDIIHFAAAKHANYL